MELRRLQIDLEYRFVSAVGSVERGEYFRSLLLVFCIPPPKSRQTASAGGIRIVASHSASFMQYPVLVQNLHFVLNLPTISDLAA